MSTYLNLAISFLSIGASLIASLLLSEPKSIYGFIVVVVIIVGSLIAGMILLLLWRRSSKDATSTIQTIRTRGTSSSTGTVIEATREGRPDR
jgi:Kef-type K+ transport system membrane component KefB